ncbi:MAG: hypothetical protein QM731_03810 [Chitinophagaceae bacterium]
MTEIFRLLPLSCTPELGPQQKDTLLLTGVYTVPGGDSIETVKYTIDTNFNADYLRYEYGFTTGQQGFLYFELKRFYRTNGSVFVVFSRYGGAPIVFSQHELQMFDIVNGALVSSKEQLLPLKVPLKYFLKKGTPDAARAKLEKNVNTAYDLSPDVSNTIRYSIAFHTFEEETHIAASVMIFTWNGKTFTRKIEKDPE